MVPVIPKIYQLNHAFPVTKDMFLILRGSSVPNANKEIFSARKVIDAKKFPDIPILMQAIGSVHPLKEMFEVKSRKLKKSQDQ